MAMNGLIILVPLVWIGLFIAFGVWRRMQSGKPVAPRVPDGAAFGETRVSGRVLGGVLQRLSGANNCIVVAVDRGRLSVGLAFPFSVLPMPGLGKFDIDVPITAIARITPTRRLWQHALRIDFIDPNQDSLELVVRNEAGLVAALGPNLMQFGADRPLQAKSGARFGPRFARVFMVLWGTVFMVASGFGVARDLAIRVHGVATTGVAIGFEGKSAVIRYRADGIDYTLQSHFNGNWQIGQSETVYYQRDNPVQATEGDMLLLTAGMMMIGLIVLIFGLFGPRLIPGWS